MSNHWTSYRTRPPHDISWEFHREQNDQYYQNMEDDGSFDHDEEGGTDPSSDPFSFPDSFNGISTASVPVPGYEPADVFMVNTSPLGKYSGNRRVIDEVEVDPFFQPGIEIDSFDIAALSRIPESEVLSNQKEKQGMAGSFEAMHSDVARRHQQVASTKEANSYRMHQQDMGESYLDSHRDHYPPLQPTWGSAFNLQRVNSPSVHFKIGDDFPFHPAQHYASYPENYSHLPEYHPRRLSHDFASPLPGEFISEDITWDPSSASGERTSDLKLAPSSKALDIAGTPRAQEALKTWYDRLRELHEYRTLHGNTNVPQKYLPNQKLGVWVNKQRMEKKCYDDGKPSSMNDGKLEALRAIGFVWAKRKGQHSWDTKYNELRAYKRERGDCLVPTKYAENPALGRWVSTQRSQYKAWKNGEKNTMTEMKYKKLKSIGFVWCMLAS